MQCSAKPAFFVGSAWGLPWVGDTKKPPAEAGGKKKRLFSGEIQRRTVQHLDVVAGQGVYVGHRLPVYHRGLVGEEHLQGQLLQRLGALQGDIRQLQLGEAGELFQLRNVGDRQAYEPQGGQLVQLAQALQVGEVGVEAEVRQAPVSTLRMASPVRAETVCT